MFHIFVNFLMVYVISHQLWWLGY